MNNVRPTIIRLLSSMGGAQELRLYLKKFSQLDANRFAVVKVGGAILRDELEALVSSLGFLQQVGLTPIVIHGGGPQLDEEIGAAGIVKETVDGLRVTRPETLAVVRRVLQRENLRLVEALQEVDVRATSIPTGVFVSEIIDAERLGLVGRVTRIDTTPLAAAVSAGSIPVIASLGETETGQIVNVNADWAANELVKSIQPYKIIFLTSTGGILDGEGRLIESISLSTQYEQLMQQEWLHSGMRVKLEQIHDLLMSLPPASSLSITTPAEMAKELFTHRGSGTLVRRGEAIQTFESWNEVDHERFRGLVEASFGRSLVADYFDRTHLHRLYLSEHYRAAIVLIEVNGRIYMDKFAVSEDAQGEGLGRAMWDRMRAEEPAIYWRSQRSNRINDFYFQNADGARKSENWTVFWYGMDDWEGIGEAVARAQERPATLETPKS